MTHTKKTAPEAAEAVIRNLRARLAESEQEIKALRRDRAQLKKTQSALEESEHLLRNIAANYPNAYISIIEKDLTVGFTSGQKFKQLGLDADQFVGMTLEQVFGDNAPVVKAHYLHAFNGEEVSFEIVVHSEFSGQEIQLYRAIPLPDPEGRIHRILAVVDDITQRKKEEQQLRDTVKNLGIANRELKSFAHVVSHDLRTPLRGICSLAQWLMEDYGGQLDPKGRECLQKLHDRGLLVHSLVDALLQYSRVGRNNLDLIPLDTRRLVQEIIRGLEPPKTITIRAEDSLPTIVFDQMPMTRVLRELIGNAVTHLGKPSGEVVISCRDSDRERVWEFCVRDNGVGIEEKFQECIFQMFRTVIPSVGINAAGTGLALVKKIIERIGGHIRLESTPGAGSAFYFTVPKDIHVPD